MLEPKPDGVIAVNPMGRHPTQAVGSVNPAHRSKSTKRSGSYGAGRNVPSAKAEWPPWVESRPSCAEAMKRMRYAVRPRGCAERAHSQAQFRLRLINRNQTRRSELRLGQAKCRENGIGDDRGEQRARR